MENPQIEFVLKSTYTLSQIEAFAIGKGWKKYTTEEKFNEKTKQIEEIDVLNPDTAETFTSNYLIDFVTDEISSVAVDAINTEKEEEKKSLISKVKDEAKSPMTMEFKHI